MEARSQVLIEGIEQIVKQVGIETQLREVGIAATDLDRLTDNAMLQTRLLMNNPRELSRQDAYAIYLTAF